MTRDCWCVPDVLNPVEEVRRHSQASATQMNWIATALEGTVRFGCQCSAVRFDVRYVTTVCGA